MGLGKIYFGHMNILKNKAVKNIAYVIIVALAIIYGMSAQKYHLPPYQLARIVYEILFSPDEEISEEVRKTDIASLIRINSPKDISKIRSDLIFFLFGGNEIPSALPSKTLNGHVDSRYTEIPSLDSIDKLTITMDFNLESHMYHFFPKSPNNHVVLYHQGHDGDFYLGIDLISMLLDQGFSVIAFSMPLLGLNNQPSLLLSRFGWIKLVSHEHMKFLTPENGHPIKYFIEPVLITLNYIQKYFHYSSISMIGISGGGWTTTLAAAVDTRINKSFPVAGSYPFYLRSFPKDWGDYEQVEPALYSTANYLELYVLGSYGPQRRQIQIINKYDSCCFSGLKSNTYADIVRKSIHELGDGEFDIFIDKSHRQHIISKEAIRFILENIGKTE